MFVFAVRSYIAIFVSGKIGIVQKDRNKYAEK